MYKIVPAKSIRRLQMIWIVPSTYMKVRSKPGKYVSYILGHEGPNSLMSYLIKLGLANHLVAGNHHIMFACDYVNIEIYLTEKGEEQMELVMRIVYAVLNTLKTTEIEEYLSDELEQMCKLQFNYKNKSDASTLVINISNWIHEML